VAEIATAVRAARVLLGVILVACTAASAFGQASKSEKEVQRIITPDAFRIVLKKIPELDKGKIMMAEGTAGPDGVKFVGTNFSILQPVIVTVLAKNPDDDVRVQLSKYRYDQADRKGSTKGSGIYTTKLRTQGDLKVVVSASTPTPFQLVVWAGDEVERAIKPVVVTNPARVAGKTSGAGGMPGGSMVLWVIAIALLAVVGLLAAMLLKGKRA
jgi:hypothetical protein